MRVVAAGARHSAGDWSPPADPYRAKTSVRRWLKTARVHKAARAADLRTAAGGGDALTCRGVATVDVGATRIVAATCWSASPVDETDEPGAETPLVNRVREAD
ncbi:MAG: hypothetical protein H0W18_03610 [Acidobacteria bacterium]|nr:hypothetical protein [Acidobacteriota bacterium]